MRTDFGLHFSCQSPERDWERLYAETLRQAALGESLGYSSVFMAEHHFLDDGWIPAPLVFLGGVAAVTESVTLGTDVVVLPLHHPVSVAERAAVLDLLSGGRFRLGVAIGWRDEEFRAFGVDKRERVPRTEEGVELMRRLFSEEAVTYAGDFHSATELSLMPRPVQRPIPIWIGGQARPAIERAARLGDAWVTSQIETKDELEEKYRWYDRALEEAGRSPEEVHRPLRREVYLAEDAETAWDEVGQALLYEYEDVYGDYTDAGHTFAPDHESAVDELRAHASDRFVIGGPEAAIDEFEDYVDRFGIDEFLLRMHFPGLDPRKAEASMRLFASEVMPHFAD